VYREFQMAMDYLRPQYGQTLVDMSCGTGLFTRRFASSGRLDKVIAADFSESMLKQTQELIAKDSAIDAASVLLLRADVGRLPFQTGSVSAIHAGAMPLFGHVQYSFLLRKCYEHGQRMCHASPGNTQHLYGR
jgi:ubiquinone/menaquinone biosynthesis C-methylase UbiE